MDGIVKGKDGGRVSDGHVRGCERDGYGVVLVVASLDGAGGHGGSGRGGGEAGEREVTRPFKVRRSSGGGASMTEQ